MISEEGETQTGARSYMNFSKAVYVLQKLFN